MKIENVVYIITNPQYPGYVKIGYASDLKSRLASLNTGALVEFEPYAVYETPKSEGDLEIHRIIKLLNPILRASKFEQGKAKQKEFFKLDPEEAFQLLENIAIVSGTRDKLYRVDKYYNRIDEHEVELQNKPDYNESDNETTLTTGVTFVTAGKRPAFTFSCCEIPIGAEICFVRDAAKKAIVVDDKHVLYEEEIVSLSYLAKKLMGLNRPLQGPLYFTYNGKLLTEIREEKEGR